MKMICNLLAALLTMVAPFLAPPDQPESATATVALVSDESGLVVPASVDDEAVTARSLARNFQAQLDDAEHLSVRAHYKFLSYEVRPRSDGSTATTPVSLEIDIDSYMTRNSITSVFRREGVEKPVVTLRIGPDDASVEYYYWEIQEKMVTPTMNLSDLEDDFIYYTDDSPLLSGLWSHCEPSTFWRTWLPSSHNYWNWEKNLDWGELHDEPVVYNGRLAWKIILGPGDNATNDSRTDCYYIDKESGLLVGWQKFIVVMGEAGSFFHAGDATFEYDFESNPSVSVSASQ